MVVAFLLILFVTVMAFTRADFSIDSGSSAHQAAARHAEKKYYVEELLAIEMVR